MVLHDVSLQPHTHRSSITLPMGKRARMGFFGRSFTGMAARLVVWLAHLLAWSGVFFVCGFFSFSFSIVIDGWGWGGASYLVLGF